MLSETLFVATGKFTMRIFSLVLVIALTGCKQGQRYCLPIDGECPEGCGRIITAHEVSCPQNLERVPAACIASVDYGYSEEGGCLHRITDGKIFVFATGEVFVSDSARYYRHCDEEDERMIRELGESCIADAGVEDAGSLMYPN